VQLKHFAATTAITDVLVGIRCRKRTIYFAAATAITEVLVGIRRRKRTIYFAATTATTEVLVGIRCRKRTICPVPIFTVIVVVLVVEFGLVLSEAAPLGLFSLR